MKKTNLLLLSSLFALGLTACGGGGGGGTTPDPTPTNQTATGVPAISGTPTVGQTLTASTASIADANGKPTTFSYQWKANGAAISGATSSTYLLTANEKGKTIIVTVSFTDNDGFSESVTSSATSAVAALNTPAPTTPTNQAATGAPIITGIATVGQTLSVSTASIADVNGKPASFNYQWKANGANIAGATSTSYALTAAEKGKVITVTVSFTDNEGFSESVTSSETAIVNETNVAGKINIPVTTNFIKGTSLNASTFIISDQNGASGAKTYTWTKSGSTVANIATYTPDTSDALVLGVTYLDDGFNTESLTLNLSQRKLASASAGADQWSSTAANFVSSYASFVKVQPASYDENSLATFALGRYTVLKAALAAGTTCTSGGAVLDANTTTFTNCVTSDGTLNGTLELAKAASPVSVTWTATNLTLTTTDKAYAVSGKETSAWITGTPNTLQITANANIETTITESSKETKVLKNSGGVSTYTQNTTDWTFTQSQTSHTWERSGDNAIYIKNVVSFPTTLTGSVSGGVNQPPTAGNWKVEWNSQGIGFAMNGINEVTPSVDLDEDGNYVDESLSSTIKWDTTAN